MLKKTLYVVGALLLVALGYALFEYFAFHRQRDEVVLKQAKATTAELCGQINELLARVDDEGDRLAKLFGERDYSPEEVRELIKTSALSIRELQGVTAAYEPFGLSESKRLYAPYYNKGTQEFLQCEESYDYTKAGQSTSTWYTEVRDHGKQWVEPYYGSAAKDWYVDLGIPFFYASGPKKGQVRGTITMSFLCHDFGDLIHKMSLGKTGLGFITSNQGKFLAHPNQEFIGTKKLAEWSAPDLPKKQLDPEFKKLLDGQAGVVTLRKSGVSEKIVFCYDHLASSGWGIGMMFYTDDMLNDQVSLRRRYINITLLISLLAVCVIAAVFAFDELDSVEIWKLSVLSTVLLLANLFLVGWLEHRTDRPIQANASPAILNFSQLNQFVRAREDKAEELHLQRPTAIPTGIYIRRMDFQDSYNVNMSGSIWQKIPLPMVDKIQPGIKFPQVSPFAEAESITESYRKEIEGKEGEDGYLLVGWDFRVTFLLNFAYADFPFDKREVKIQIAPAIEHQSIELVPDLASYQFTNPSNRSGIDDTIDLCGVDITESFFNYTVEDYDTDFGFGSKHHQRQTPTLLFNVHLRRDLLNAFVTYLIPIVVALVMIFILLCACRKTSERQGIIESMAAFLFVLIFSHIDLRKEVVTGELIYLESFYFITYAMVLLSTFNLMAFTLDRTKIFDFNDNQIFKAIFFPLFVGAVLAITLFKFY